MICECSLRSDDPRLEVYRHLKRTNLTRWSGRFVAEGDKVVDRLLGSGLAIESVLVAREWLDRYRHLVPDEVPLLVVDDRELSELVGFEFHRGVLACGRRPARLELEAILPQNQANWTLVICANVQGPDNLGNILRSCAAFGADAVLLGRESADPFSRRVLRVSMGELLRLPLRHSDDLAADLRQLREHHGVELVATVLDESAESLASLVRRSPRLGIVLGGEGNGLPTEVAAACQRQVTIPMSRGTDSLNVATAAGVFLYELTKPFESDRSCEILPGNE